MMCPAMLALLLTLLGAMERSAPSGPWPMAVAQATGATGPRADRGDPRPIRGPGRADAESGADPGSGDGGPVPRRRGAPPLSEEDLDELIEIAGRITPEWGEALRAKRDADRDGLRESIASAGPRLMGLLVLKRNHPELFELRIEDLRIQNELRSIARAYRELAAAEATRRAELEEQLRQKVQRQVDLELRARALELAALDAQLRRMVEELSNESRDRAVKVERLIKEIKAGEDPRSLVRPGMGPGERDGRPLRGLRRPGQGAGAPPPREGEAPRRGPREAEPDRPRGGDGPQGAPRAPEASPNRIRPGQGGGDSPAR